jgi:glycosyltransferase involved in cell wall biosynthesis
MNTLSVILATYNENRGFLQNCIQSILNQTYGDFELLIVIEPGESNRDYLNHVSAADNRVRIIENSSRLGVSASRNRAILESRGQYVALIDGDDYCDVSRFEKQISFLEENPEISVVGSNMFLVDEKDNIVGERKYPELHEDIRRYFLLAMAVANPAIMTRMKDLKKIGLFDDHFSKAEDVELWLRFLAGNKKMYNLRDHLVYYRVLTNSNEKRGQIHYKNFYIARKRYNKQIWPFHLSLLSLSFFYIISHIPNTVLDILHNLSLVNKMKSIERN